MSALAWLNDLIQWLGRWIPRLMLIHQTHRGVRVGPRGGAVAVGPGLVCYWPITHEIVLVPVTLQSIQLCGQILPTDSDESFVPRIAVCVLNVQYTISDPVKAAMHVLHFQAIVNNRAQSLAALHWLRSGDRTSSAWLDAAEADLREEMRAYGIEIATLQLGGIGIGVALKNISDWGYSDSTDGKRPS